jgi:glycosyltransferase involved in cell wall biosynthesis
MSRNDVLVLPSLTEAFGLVITEALSCGLPVIVTPNSGGPEVISHGENGFIVPIRSSESIAEKLDLLHRDRDRLSAMSLSAFQRASECSWANYRARISQIIRDIVNP